MVHGVAELLLERLPEIVAAELPIFIDRARDDADMQALGTPWLTVDVKGEARFAAVSQPFLEAQAIALGLGDLLALFVEEHLVIEPFGRPAAERAGDLARLGDAVDQVLASHLVIDAEGDPPRRPIDLPLQLGLATESRLDDAAAVLVVERDLPGFGVDDLDGHL